MSKIVCVDFHNPQRRTESAVINQIRTYCTDFKLSPEQTQRVIEPVAEAKARTAA